MMPEMQPLIPFVTILISTSRIHSGYSVGGIGLSSNRHSPSLSLSATRSVQLNFHDTVPSLLHVGRGR